MPRSWIPSAYFLFFQVITRTHDSLSWLQFLTEKFRQGCQSSLHKRPCWLIPASFLCVWVFHEVVISGDIDGPRGRIQTACSIVKECTAFDSINLDHSNKITDLACSCCILEPLNNEEKLLKRKTTSLTPNYSLHVLSTPNSPLRRMLTQEHHYWTQQFPCLVQSKIFRHSRCLSGQKSMCDACVISPSPSLKDEIQMYQATRWWTVSKGNLVANYDVQPPSKFGGNRK